MTGAGPRMTGWAMCCCPTWTPPCIVHRCSLPASASLCYNPTAYADKWRSHALLTTNNQQLITNKSLQGGFTDETP